MSQWDALTDDDKDWALAAELEPKCPICGGHDPEQLCQNPRYQHAWEVTTRRCYKTRAVLMEMERFKNDPYAGTVVPIVTLNEALAKPA